jgi:phage-related protein
VAKKVGLELVIGLVDEASSGLEKITGGIKGMALVGGGLAVAGLTALGKAAWDAGQQYDAVMDTFVTKTGASGEALEQLGADFQAVFTSIPVDAQVAADVMAALAQKTGMTGTTLQETTKQIAEMTRLLGGDAAATADNFGRVMGDWGVSADDASLTLDKMFVAAQNSGIGVDQLMQKSVQFGAALRNMGFTLDESVALLAKWEKEGVNTELVLGSLRIAAGNFAKEGKPLKESLLETFDAIKNNTDASAALALGMEVFGARAGPDMVAAIREGRFSIDDLTAAMGDAEGAIMETADATADFPEKIQVLRNKVTSALMPLGGLMVTGLTAAVDAIGPAIDTAVGWVEGLGEPVRQVGEIFEGLYDIIVKGSEPLGDWSSWWERFAALFGEDVADALLEVGFVIDDVMNGIRATIATVWPQVQAVVQTAISIIQPLIETFATRAQEIMTAAWTQIQAIIEQVWPIIQEIIATGTAIINEFINTHGAEIQAFMQSTWASIQQIIDLAWQVIGGLVQKAIEGIQNYVVPAFQAIATFLGDHSAEIQTVLGGAWTALQGIVQVAIDLIKGILQTALLIIEGDWEGAWESVKATGEALWGDIQRVIDGAVTILKTTLGTAWEEVKSGAITAWEGIRDGIVGAFDGAIQGIKDILNSIIDAMNTAISAFNSLPGPDIGLIGRLATGALSYGGGLALVGEHGPELVSLPIGSRVYSAGETQRMNALRGGDTYYIDARGSVLTEAQIQARFEAALLAAGRRADVRERMR